MVTIKLFKENTYYRNKCSDKEYLDGSDGDNTLISAAMLTGKGLNTEEECIYCGYGETEDEAEMAIENYLKANPNHPMILRKEVINGNK